MANELNQFLNQLPQWLIALKGQQNQKEQQQKEFMFKQQQAAQQQMNIEQQRKDRNKQERLSIFTELIGDTKDPSSQSVLTKMLAKEDPENAGFYGALAGQQEVLGNKREADLESLRNYMTGNISESEFFGSIDPTSEAFKQGLNYSEARGKKIHFSGGYMTIYDPRTGKKTDIPTGAGQGMDIYKKRVLKLREQLYGDETFWIDEDLIPEMKKELEYYESKLSKSGIDVYTGK